MILCVVSDSGKQVLLHTPQHCSHSPAHHPLTGFMKKYTLCTPDHSKERAPWGLGGTSIKVPGCLLPVSPRPSPCSRRGCIHSAVLAHSLCIGYVGPRHLQAQTERPYTVPYAQLGALTKNSYGMRRTSCRSSQAWQGRNSIEPCTSQSSVLQSRRNAATSTTSEWSYYSPRLRLTTGCHGSGPPRDGHREGKSESGRTGSPIASPVPKMYAGLSQRRCVGCR